MMEYIIVDLDGTLCDCAHRQHLAKASEWEKFHELSIYDKVFPDLLTIINAFCAQNIYKIVAVTGRTENYRQKNYDWFVANNLLHKIDMLLMRPENNYKKDGEMKLGLIKEAGIEISDIAFALDDSETVVSAFREAGITAYQVRSGSY